jgi:hypothetical protein
MEPFGLPRGTVRGAIVGLLIVAVVILGLFGAMEAFTALVGILGAAVRDYFAHRELENRVAGAVLPEPEEG